MPIIPHRIPFLFIYLTDMKSYITITCDIINSSSVTSNIQKDFHKIIRNINRLTSPKVPFMITVWDEFQGIYESDYPIGRSIKWILRSMPYYRVRIGIGIGSIITPISKSSRCMYGNSVINSRKAIDFCKESDSTLRFIPSNSKYKYIDDYLKIISFYLDSFTLIQRRRVIMYRNGKSIRNIAKLENVSPNTIRNMLNIIYPKWIILEKGLYTLDKMSKVIGK